MTPLIGKRRVDQAFDAYVDWREECAAVQHAYERWLRGAKPDAALRFRAYRAALDREERASEVFASLTRRPGAIARRVQAPRPVAVPQV